MGRIPDDPPVNFDDVRADYAETLDWHLRLARYIGPLHFGDPAGALVSRRYVQRQARAVLLAAINRLKPDIASDLLTPELDNLVNRYGEARMRWLDQNHAPDLTSATEEDLLSWGEAMQANPDIHRAAKAWRKYVADWQGRHGLTHEWFGEVQYSTASFDDSLRLHRIEPPEPVLLVIPDGDRYIDMYGQPRGPRRKKPANPFTLLSAEPTPGRRILWLDDLKYPTIEYEHGVSEDAGDFAEYDVGADNIDAAVLRIMPELERRLRRVLEAIEAEEQWVNDMVAPVKCHTRGFDWAARCLVGGDSRNSIAAADGIDRATVSREVAEVASLTGIPIPRKVGGRPRRPRAVTKRVR